MELLRRRSLFPVLLIAYACSVKYTVTGQINCNVVGLDSCVCDTPQGRIDLTSIANSDGTPRFKNIQGETFGRYEYSYNPCYGFQTGTNGCGINGAVNAACQEETSFDDQYSCGLTSTETFKYYTNGKTELQYDGGDVGRITVVEVICDESATTPSIRAFDDGDVPYRYDFQLRTECGCPGRCHGSKPKPGGGAGGHSDKSGAIGLTLIFLSLFGLALYFVIGIVVRKYHFQKSGREMIPNHEFWFVLPYLIKDGALFTFNSIRGLVRKGDKSPSDYDKL